MAGVTHYEVLGLRPDASPEEIRRAYLHLAREHHPDRHGADAARLDAAERRMRDINAAWAVLGDADQRARYDRTLAGAAGPAVTSGGSPESTVHRPSTEFRPYFDEDEDDDDSWRYEPDEFDPATSVGRFLGAGPPLLLLAGFGLLAVSLVVGFRPLAAVAVACLLLAAVLFLGAPLAAVLKSQIHEQRRSSQRRPGGR